MERSFNLSGDLTDRILLEVKPGLHIVVTITEHASDVVPKARGVNESMDGRGCAILALELAPKI